MTGPDRRAGWTPARIISAVIGVLVALCSLGFLAAGGVALWASTTQRHEGDIGLGTWNYDSTGYGPPGGYQPGQSGYEESPVRKERHEFSA